MRAGDLAGTVGYAALWLWLSVGLLVAVLAWNVGLLVWARPRRVRTSAPVRVDPQALRARARARIDELDRAHASGHLDDRTAHRELSGVCRGFVDELTGLGARSLTLAELRVRDAPTLVEVVERAYPVAFSAREDWPREGWAEAVARAREVVAAPWT